MPGPARTADHRANPNPQDPGPRAGEFGGSGGDAKNLSGNTSLPSTQDCLRGSHAAAHSSQHRHLYTADPVSNTSTHRLARQLPFAAIIHRLCIPTCTADHDPSPELTYQSFMQSGLIETPNHDFRTTNAPLPQPTTAQHGPGRSRSSLPDACSPPPAPSTSLHDAQGSGCAAFVCGLDVGHLDQTLGRLSVAETKSAAAARATAVAGQRISEYENAAVSSSPRRDSHPPLGFKVTHSSRSDGVQLVDFPNGSSLPSRPAFAAELTAVAGR